jgi:pyruvate formate lyase activating enzyme
MTEDGACSACGGAIAGRFGRYRGAFGQRRIPVRLAGFAA